jgi:hypothetical protein
MNDTSPAESKPPEPVPADDPGRVLTHVSPDTDDSLPHLGVVGDTSHSSRAITRGTGSTTKACTLLPSAPPNVTLRSRRSCDSELDRARRSISSSAASKRPDACFDSGAAIRSFHSRRAAGAMATGPRKRSENGRLLRRPEAV